MGAFQPTFLHIWKSAREPCACALLPQPLQSENISKLASIVRWQEKHEKKMSCMEWNKLKLNWQGCYCSKFMTLTELLMKKPFSCSISMCSWDFITRISTQFHLSWKLDIGCQKGLNIIFMSVGYAYLRFPVHAHMKVFEYQLISLNGGYLTSCRGWPVIELYMAQLVHWITDASSRRIFQLPLKFESFVVSTT